MTLREFYALADRCQDVRDWQNRRTALICAVAARIGGTKNAKVEDFMPGLAVREPQTPEQMLEVVKMLNAAHGGNFGPN